MGTPAAAAAQQRPLGLRCASPLPRAEVFCARPTSARPRSLAPKMHLPAIPPAQAVPPKAPMSPGSSITDSNSVSPSSSAASGASVSGLIRRIASVAEKGVRGERGAGESPQTTAADVDGEGDGAIARVGGTSPAEPVTREYDIFEEDDFTDRFDSFNVNFDPDAAMDEYLVFSRRYDSGIKMRREVREALPKKNVVGGALWERLYSDVSMQFAGGRDSGDQRMPLRKMFSDADYSNGGKRMHPGRERFRSGGAKLAAKDALPARSVSSNELMTRPRRGRRSPDTEATKSVARDEFLEFQNVRRRQGPRKQRDTQKLIEACKRFLRCLVPRRRR